MCYNEPKGSKRRACDGGHLQTVLQNAAERDDGAERLQRRPPALHAALPVGTGRAQPLSDPLRGLRLRRVRDARPALLPAGGRGVPGLAGHGDHLLRGRKRPLGVRLGGLCGQRRAAHPAVHGLCAGPPHPAPGERRGLPPGGSAHLRGAGRGVPARRAHDGRALQRAGAAHAPRKPQPRRGTWPRSTCARPRPTSPITMRCRSR